MTLDDESSVYVGGLAYNSTEDMLQKAFETYGDINSIKIVYDRESRQSRGFGFVTFTNPRAAAKAIHGLDGGVLGGRTIRVNEVKKNSGKALTRDASFRDRGEKNRDRREGRDRDRDHNGRGRHFSPQRNRRPSPAQRRSPRCRSPIVSPGQGRSARNLSPPCRRSRSSRAERARSTSFNSSSAGQPCVPSSPTSPSPQSSNRLHRGDDGTYRSTVLSSRVVKEKQTNVVKVRAELDRAVQSRQELEDKVTNLTSAVEQARETVTVLKSKSQKLEGSLASALASASHCHHQLRKLRKGILQVRDSSDQLELHEKELKVIMAATMADLEVMDVDTEDRQVAAVGNGGKYDSDRKAEGGGPK